jgi:hypothetical protein
MTVADFLRDRPCLEELSGFIKGLPGYEPSFTAGEMDQLNAYRSRLMAGEITPCKTNLIRAYVYRQGHRPKKA